MDTHRSNFMMFVIDGEAIPQGSKTVAQGGGKVWLRDANPKLKRWRETVTAQVLEQMQANEYEQFQAHAPIRAILLFQLPKPKSVNREYPTVKPDIDKLTRAIFDSLEAANVMPGDQQITSVHASKYYCAENDTPKVYINLHIYTPIPTKLKP